MGPAGVDAAFSTNLASAFYWATAAMKLMQRPNRDGVLIHTASWAGRFISPVSGAAYGAAKPAVIALRYAIHVQEYMNGICSTAVLRRRLPLLSSTYGRGAVAG